MSSLLRIDFVEFGAQALEISEGRLAHIAKNLVFGMLRGYLHTPGSMAEHQFTQIFLGAAVHKTVGSQEEVVSYATAHIRVANALYGIHLTVEFQKVRVVAVQICAGCGEKAAAAAAYPSVFAV